MLTSKRGVKLKIMKESIKPSEIRQAVAMRYNKDENNAPVVVATGQGWLAEKIIEIAQEKNVAVLEDKNLVQSLRVLNVNEEIPLELYEALASILAFVFKVDEEQNKL